MNYNNLLRSTGFIIICTLLLSLLPVIHVQSQATDQTGAATHTIYLPVIHYQLPGEQIFGIEMKQIAPETGLDLVLTSGTKWIRRNALLWKDVEPTEGAGYIWDHSRIKSLEQEMIRASQNNLKLIVIVRGSPSWATQPYDVDCAPINRAKYDAFARFMAAVVARYSRPPYNVTYWEIGNEPDAYLFPHDSPMGCWGIVDDPYYGGRAYGEMLKRVAPAMKAANPEIKILNGGLLLDRPYTPGDTDGHPGRFMEGVFRVGAGNAFDIMSFHTYAEYDGRPELVSVDDWRITYLRDMMQDYGIPLKPMIRTESALLCRTVTPECRWAQADYVGMAFARSFKDELLANIWYVYDNDSYHNTALIEPGDVFRPRQAYYAFRHAASMLNHVEYLGPLSDQPAGVEGYRFKRGSETVVIVWSIPWQSIAIPVPPGATVRCTDRDGGALACSNDSGNVRVFAQRSPIYVVWR